MERQTQLQVQSAWAIQQQISDLNMELRQYQMEEHRKAQQEKQQKNQSKKSQDNAHAR